MGYSIDDIRRMLRNSGQRVDQYSDEAIGENLGQYNSDYDSTQEVLNQVEPEYQKAKKSTQENFAKQRTDMQDLMNRLGVLNSGITLNNIGKINKNEGDRLSELDTNKANQLTSLRNKLANINTNYLGRIGSLSNKYRQAAYESSYSRRSGGGRSSAAEQEAAIQNQANALIKQNMSKFKRPVDFVAQMGRNLGIANPVFQTIQEAVAYAYPDKYQEFETWKDRPWWKNWG